MRPLEPLLHQVNETTEDEVADVVVASAELTNLPRGKGGGEHGFAFNEAISFIVNCDTQEEIDHYWNALSAVPEAEQCGWLKDKFGLSWQIVPTAMNQLMAQGGEVSKRVTDVFMKMKKFDIAALEYAAKGE